MNWLATVVAKCLHEALDFLWGKGESLQQQPKETTDANTPPDVRDQLNGSVSDWVRRKDDQGH